MNYNPQTDDWVFIGGLKEGRYDHSAIVINNRVFLIGGQIDFVSEVCTITVPWICSPVNEIKVSVKKPKLFAFSRSNCYISTEIPVYEEKNNTNSILVLTQKYNKNIDPSIINTEIYYQPHIKSTLFKKDKTHLNVKVSIIESCSILHRNKLYVYGGTDSAGTNFKNQVLELDCKTKKLEERAKLHFDFVQGSCASNNVVIVLCFAKIDRKLCYKSIGPALRNWWESFTQIKKSLFAHAEGALAMSEGQFKIK